MILANPGRFFDLIRMTEFEGTLSEPQVQGFNTLLAAIPPSWDKRWVAYLLATAIWETNHTMQPVREAYWLSEAWRKSHLRYYPYYGRGYVQLTWEYNYKLFSHLIGKDLVSVPDLALNPGAAAQIIVYGMEHGSFTGRGFSTTLTNFIGERAIINGMDHAQAIAAIAENALLALE